MVVKVANLDKNVVIGLRVDRVQVPQERKDMTKFKASSLSRVTHLNIVSWALAHGVHPILMTPRVDVVIVPILEVHVFIVVS